MVKKIIAVLGVVGILITFCLAFGGVYERVIPNATTGGYTITRIMLKADTAATTGGFWRDRDTITSKLFNIEKMIASHNLDKPVYMGYGISWSLDTGHVLTSTAAEADTTGDTLIMEMWSSMNEAKTRVKRVHTDTIVPTAILTSKVVGTMADSAFWRYVYFKIIYIDSNVLEPNTTNDTNTLTINGIDVWVK